MKLPQLTLRELFLLVALVAMGCGWWLHTTSMEADFKRFTDAASLGQYNAGRRLDVLEIAVEREGYAIEWNGEVNEASFDARLTKKIGEQP